MIPVEINKKYTVTVDAVSSDGNGVARIDGFAVFIPLTAPGDEAEIQITRVQNRCAWGRLVNVLKPSPLRAEKNCVYYGQCGGCQLRHIKYEAQLDIKKDIIENAMRRIGGFKDFTPDDIIGMDTPERYRNKMVFPAGRADGKNVCGFYAPRSHDVIELSDCVIGDEANARICGAVLEYMNENNAAAYDESSHSGTVRHIFTRVSFSTGEIMVVISANTKNLPRRERLIKKLRNVSDRITSIILNINTRRGKTVITDKNITLWGKDRISDTLGGIKFTISPQSFFQVNPVQTEKLYAKALEYANIDKTKSVMDIYCGIGTISLCAAKRAKNVIGVEIVKKAIDDAAENAETNNIQNVLFYADSAENIVPKLISRGETPDIIILDPPRSGSDEATLSAIIHARPERIVYVSCNPSTLARDARFLADGGYTITRSCGFDLFPHTVHVETVILMERN